jgi:hypothetical protein
MANTIPTINLNAPVVVTYNPRPNAAGVGYAQDILLTFNEPIHQGTTGTIEIHQVNASGPLIQASSSFNGSLLTIDPTSDLLPGTQYNVTLHEGSVQDSTGNNFAGETFYFTTGYTSIGVDPYASAVSSGGVNSEVAFAGLTAFGLLQWIIF